MKAILFPQPGGTIYVKRTLRSLNLDGDASVCLVMSEGGDRVVGSIVSVGDESLIIRVRTSDPTVAINTRYYYMNIDYVVVTGQSF